MESDYLIVGGGLSGGLVALALARAGRGTRVRLVESGPRLGGNHTWSFHDTDLDDEEHRLVAPLVATKWPAQLVKFPGHARILRAGYSSISSERFHDVMSEQLAAGGVRRETGRVSAVNATSVLLEDGRRLSGAIVIDARGPDAAETRTCEAFQKFVGLELELEADGPWHVPVLMDATVPQLDGYRFIYVLPFERRRVLVEDTTYSDNPTLDVPAIEARVLAYADAHGARVARVVRCETGVLPLPLHGSSPRGGEGAPVAIGYRGGFFHPVTGYSLPQAARLALAIAAAGSPEAARAAQQRVAHELAGQHRFGRLLNRLMFQAMPPAARWNALERFYRLPEATIARFYASRTTLADRARMLVGRPPRGISWRHLLGVGAA